MPTKQQRIEHTRQAIANLEAAIAVLKDDGAAEAAFKPYTDNLANEKAKLKKLLAKSAIRDGQHRMVVMTVLEKGK